MKNRREKKYIFQLMLRYKKELILNTVLSFFLLAIYMVTPILEQKIIDEGILSKDYVILLKLVFIAAFSKTKSSVSYNGSVAGGAITSVN